MKIAIDWNLLARFVCGECSNVEEAAVQAWAQQKPGRQQFLDGLHGVWVASGYRASEEWDVDGLWKRVQTSVRERGDLECGPRPAVQLEAREAVERSPNTRSPRSAAGLESAASDRRHLPPTRRASARSPASLSLRVAAVIAIAAVIVLVSMELRSRSSTVPGATAEKVFATQPGEWTTVRLIDGTRVELNADSRLHIMPAFGQDSRQVELEGQAYFEVARDTTRPFIVHVEDAAVQVLGTAFDVNAYAEEGDVQVVVAEGTVAVQARSQARSERSVLAARQMATLPRTGAPRIAESVDLSRYLAWREGRLLFDDAPFQEVASQLERWYGLEVSPSTEGGFRGHLNARFTRDQPLSEVLSVIAAAFGLRAEQEGSRVIFSRPE